MSDFKVRCVVSNCSTTTLDKVYEVKNGCLRFDDGQLIGVFENIKELNNSCTSKFVLVLESKTDPAQFTKDMLKTGMRVENRNGKRYIVFLDTPEGSFIIGTTFDNLDNFSNDLKLIRNTKTFQNYDIVKVFDCPYGTSINDLSEVGELLWTRPTPKHYTISEAEAKLSELDNDGQPVEIGG